MNSDDGNTPADWLGSRMRDARRRRLSADLRALGKWCLSRADGDHNEETTLSMLERRAGNLRRRCMEAGWRAQYEPENKS